MRKVWGRKIPSLQLNSPILSKHSKLGSLQSAGCNEIRPEILKALNQEGVLCLSYVWQVSWCSGRAPDDCQTRVIIPIHIKGDWSECTNNWAFLSLDSQEKCVPRALKKDAAKYFNQSWNIPSAVFVPAIMRFSSPLSRPYPMRFSSGP